MVRPLPSRTAAAAALAIVAGLLTGCGTSASGSTGDPPTEPEANALGDCARLTDVLREPSWVDPKNEDSIGCSQPVDGRVCVSGVTVVAIDKYDETGEGATGNYYVQDTRKTPVPYSGVTVYAPSFSPPDLRLAPGDVTDLVGSFTEFLGPSSGRFGQCRTLPEVSGAMTLRFEGGSLTPMTIPLDEMLTYESARKYMGMLVRIEDVVISDKPSSSGGRYSAPLKVNVVIPADAQPRLSNELYPLQTAGLEDGTVLKAVTGVVTYFYGFKIAPRSADDLEI